MSIADVALPLGPSQRSLDEHGLRRLELYLQVSPWSDGRRNVTAALVNRNSCGETRNESEERSFFQVSLEVFPGTGTEMVARPASRAAIDDDDRVSSETLGE